MGKPLRIVVAAAIAFTLLCAGGKAWAIPAFARKYSTSCTTCHTVFPKLTPFGEAFRRNGYRFPGVDSDFVKPAAVPLGQEQYKQVFPSAVWPGVLPGGVPLAVGFTGQAVAHPDKSSGGAAADGGTRFTIQDLTEEGHLWAGGSFDDSMTFFAELTFAPDGVELEHATVHFEDLLGCAHLVNVVVGKGMATLSSFGPHSTYLVDTALPLLPMTALYGATSDSFALVNNTNAIEVNGTIIGRIDYSVGLAAGANVDVHNSQDVYAHVGYKLGGMSLDGEESEGKPPDPSQEHSVTIDAFFYRSTSHFTNAMDAVDEDDALVFGGSARGQWGSFELDTGLTYQEDDHALVDGSSARALANWNEATYAIYPWLVVGARVDFLRLAPDRGATVSDLRIVPGVVALVRPNLKLTLVANLERADGAPDAGWEPAAGLAAPSDPTATVGPELESIQLALFYAY